MQLSFGRQLSGLVGASALAVAISVAGTTGAQAAQRVAGGECGQVGVEYSVDGGATWTTQGRVGGDTAPKTFQVRLSGQVTEGCQYPVSLAAYNTQGATWESSGEQKFLGWDTTVLSSAKTQATLDVSAYPVSCFGQIDLYNNGKKFDGVQNPLPHYPDGVFPHDLITAWNGAAPCASPTPSGTPSGKPSASASASTSPSPSAKPSTPATTPSAKPSASVPAGGVPAPSVSPVTGSTAAPVGKPVVSPVSTPPKGSLAETGGDSTQTTVLASAGAALVVLGGGAVYLTRRKRAHQN